MRTRLFAVVVLLLSFTTAIRLIRGDHDRVPVSTPLTHFPQAIDGLSGVDIPVPDETLQVLGAGFFLNRVYTDAAVVAPSPGVTPSTAGIPPVGLFIGYFPTQRTGQSIHSPQNCLPGSGWTFEVSGVTELNLPGGHPETVGQYLISDGTHEAVVLYWYQTQGLVIASDYKAKAYMLMDSIRYGRTDAALVRVTTFVQSGETRQQAQLRAHQFAEKMAPLLPAYIPN